MEPISELLLRKWIDAGPAPVAAAGSRLVTIYGDVHRANLVRTSKGLQFIDMEAACVNYAVHDIGYSFGLVCESAEHKEALTRAYLVECGLPAQPDDVFALRLDTELICNNHGEDNQKFAFDDDRTLSPVGNRDVVWGMREGGEPDPRRQGGSPAAGRPRRKTRSGHTDVGQHLSRTLTRPAGWRML